VKLSARTPEKKLKLLLIDRDLELAEVSRGTGLSISLIEKIATGHRIPTARTAARLENFLGARIFSEPVQFRMRTRRAHQSRTFILPASAEIKFDKENDAIAAEREFTGYVIRDGTLISFIKPTPVMIGEREAQ
jgi:transcriptional regulator with XRE-family HTH domain